MTSREFIEMEIAKSDSSLARQHYFYKLLDELKELEDIKTRYLLIKHNTLYKLEEENKKLKEKLEDKEDSEELKKYKKAIKIIIDNNLITVCKVFNKVKCILCEKKYILLDDDDYNNLMEIING